MPIILFGRDYRRRLVDFGGFVEVGVVASQDLALFRLRIIRKSGGRLGRGAGT